MPQLRIITLLVLGFVNTFAQDGYPPCEAYEEEGKDTIQSLISFSNTLYLGIDNLLKINCNNLPIKSIKLKTNNGYIFREDECNYLLIPSKAGWADLEISSSLDSNFIFKKRMKVVKLPKPYPLIGFKKLTDSVVLTKKELLETKKFRVESTADIRQEANFYEINDFSIGYTIGRMYMKKTSQSDELTTEMQNIIKSFYPGQMITIQFYIRSEGDLIQSLVPVKIFVY